MTDSIELNVAIIRAGKTKKYLANRLGISEQAFINKVNNLSEFKASEITIMQTELNLTDEKRDLIFLTINVNNIHKK